MGKYDTCMKAYLQNKRRFADLFNGSCFQGRQVIRAEDLQDATEGYVIADTFSKGSLEENSNPDKIKNADASDKGKWTKKKSGNRKTEIFRDVKMSLRSGMILQILAARHYAAYGGRFGRTTGNGCSFGRVQARNRPKEHPCEIQRPNEPPCTQKERWLLLHAAEPAIAVDVVVDGTPQHFAPAIGEEFRHEIKLGVSRLPWQEVGGTLLAGGADHQIAVGNIRIVQMLGDHLLRHAIA